MQEVLGIRVVVLHHVAAVPLGGLRAGALMKNCLDSLGKRRISRQPLNKIVLVEVVGYRQIGDIDELVSILEIVNHDDIVVPAVRKRVNEVAANESGTAGDDIHTYSEPSRM